MNNLVIKIADIDNANIVHKLDSEYEHDKYSLDTIKSSLKQDTGFNLLVWLEDEAVAYASFNVVYDEVELLKIVVSQNHRRQGIARKLMEFAIDNLKSINVKTMYLEVRRNNIPAKSLYEKMGFIKINERLKYYSDGEDADIFKLSL